LRFRDGSAQIDVEAGLIDGQRSNVIVLSTQIYNAGGEGTLRRNGGGYGRQT
jgi:hypothetical protein